jgi:lipopolysaccharide transport system ATP-binding protein
VDQADRFWALKDISFDLEQGDRVGIIGKNGAGKSTLLKILSRITAPTEGQIKIKGLVTSLLEVGTGFHGELTGRENIYLNGAILGMKKRQIDQKIEEIIEFSGIERHIDTPVKRYSSGMYVRLAFAVAAHLDSDILIADEVLSVGDAEFQKKALGKMQDLSSGHGRTVIFVSHNMATVKQLCNIGMIMDKGKIIQIGNIDDSIAHYLNSNHTVASSWKSDDESHRKDNVRICEIYLTDPMGLKLDRAVENTEIIFFNMVFQLYFLDPKLTIGFSLISPSGESIFRSLTTDKNDELNANFIIGVNHLVCRLPIDFLQSGVYYINADCSIHQEKWLINPDSDNEYGVEINIMNTSFGPKHSSNSKISPLVSWQYANSQLGDITA